MSLLLVFPLKWCFFDFFWKVTRILWFFCFPSFAQTPPLIDNRRVKFCSFGKHIISLLQLKSMSDRGSKMRNWVLMTWTPPRPMLLTAQQMLHPARVLVIDGFVLSGIRLKCDVWAFLLSQYGSVSPLWLDFACRLSFSSRCKNYSQAMGFIQPLYQFKFYITSKFSSFGKIHLSHRKRGLDTSYASGMTKLNLISSSLPGVFFFFVSHFNSY